MDEIIYEWLEFLRSFNVWDARFALSGNVSPVSEFANQAD